jgi:hypothetical protein
MRNSSASRSSPCDNLESVLTCPLYLRIFFKLRLDNLRCNVKKMVAVSLVLVILLTPAVQAEDAKMESKNVKLRRGQVLELSLETPMDSAHAQVGDQLSFSLMAPLKVGPTTILPQGWGVHGQITKVRRAGKNCKSGEIRWKLQPVRTPDGRKIKIQFISDSLATLANGADQVPLDSVSKKIGRTAKYTLMAPIVAPLAVVVLPWIVLLYIGMHGEGGCSGEAGVEEQIPPGTHSYAAVSRDIRFAQIPAIP